MSGGGFKKYVLGLQDRFDSHTSGQLFNSAQTVKPRLIETNWIIKYKIKNQLNRRGDTNDYSPNYQNRSGKKRFSFYR